MALFYIQLLIFKLNFCMKSNLISNWFQLTMDLR